MKFSSRRLEEFIPAGGKKERKIQVNQGLHVYPLAGWRSDFTQSLVSMEMLRDFL